MILQFQIAIKSCDLRNMLLNHRWDLYCCVLTFGNRNKFNFQIWFLFVSRFRCFSKCELSFSFVYWKELFRPWTTPMYILEIEKKLRLTSILSFFLSFFFIIFFFLAQTIIVKEYTSGKFKDFVYFIFSFYLIQIKLQRNKKIFSYRGWSDTASRIFP